MTQYRLLGMLGALTGAAFLISTCSVALSPFLQAMADDLQTHLAAITNLVSFLALSWGISSLFIGALSDRIGRKPILVAAVVGMCCAQLGFSQAPDYVIAVCCQIFAGVSGGAFFGTVFAAVSDHVPNERRGRALGWVITGQSLSLVLGVPLIALLGSVGGWRGAVFGMNITSASIGWLASAALGGWLVTHTGFSALGVLSALAAALGAILGIAHWRMRHYWS